MAVARRRDPGYHLIGKGRRGFEKQLGFQIPPRQWLARANEAVGVSGYLGAIAIVTAIIVALALLWCARGVADGSSGCWGSSPSYPLRMPLWRW